MPHPSDPSSPTSVEIVLPQRALIFLHGYAAAKEISISQCIALCIDEWIEDKGDALLAMDALAAYEADPTVYTPQEAHKLWDKMDNVK